MAGPLPSDPLLAPPPGQGVSLLPPEALACLPERLHPVSRYFLDRWLDGTLTTPEFLRWFHMPNSDYLEVGRCLLTAVTGG
jgi:hypothetical protein